MKIAVEPDSSRWVTIPPFPPPGWARDEARLRAASLGVTWEAWVEDLSRLLDSLSRGTRGGSLVRVLSLVDADTEPFAVDLSLRRAGDDSTRAGRCATQLALVDEVLPAGARGPVEALRPASDMAGFLALAVGQDDAGPESTRAVVVLRMAGLPTVPVDLVMRAWGAPVMTVAAQVEDLLELARAVAPLRA